MRTCPVCGQSFKPTSPNHRRCSLACRSLSRRGPWPAMRGEGNPRAKLTAEQVRAIRADYAAGTVSQHALARRYRVTHPAIWAVLHHKTWIEVPEADDGDATMAPEPPPWWRS